MADKIAKLLAKLPPEQLAVVQAVLVQILANNFDGLDIKTLKGHPDTFRVRVGDYRIIFKVADKQPRILAIARRNEKTYRDL